MAVLRNLAAFGSRRVKRKTAGLSLPFWCFLAGLRSPGEGKEARLTGEKTRGGLGG